MAKVGDRLGRYQLDRALGRGAVGAVFAATDTRLGEQVCIKVLHPAYARDAEVRARFEREVLLARKIAHRGVARVFDLGEEGETLYLIMQLVEGEPLSLLLDRELLAPARAVALIRQACQAVAAAHLEGVIHRDLKPANMMVSPDGTLRVLDFGIAMGAGMGRLTEPGKVVGSAAYMAPELWKGETASVATDIWALGVVLYRCLTGRLPFLGEDWTAVSDAVRLKEAPPPSSLRVDLDPALDQIVALALHKDPAFRPTGADELDQLLAPWTPDAFQAEVSSPRLSAEFLQTAAGTSGDGGEPVVTTEQTGSAVTEFTQVVSRSALSALDEQTVDVDREPKQAFPTWALGGALLIIAVLLLSIVALLWPGDDAGDQTLVDGSVPVDSGPSRSDRPGQHDLEHPAPPDGVGGEDAGAVAGSDDVDDASADGGEPVRVDHPDDDGGATDAETLGDDETGAPDAGGPAQDEVQGPGASTGERPTSAGQERPSRRTTTRKVRHRNGEKKAAYNKERQLLNKAIANRGLRSGDVPAVDRARRKMLQAVKKRRWDMARQQASVARQAAARTVVDRAFINRKLGRFNGRYDAVEDPAAKKELGDLSIRISKAVRKKDYAAANTLLNRGFAKAAKAR